MANKYYKAKLYSCDKDLKYINKGEIRYRNIQNHLIDMNMELIIEVREDGSAVEYRIEEPIPFLYFDKVLLSTTPNGIKGEYAASMSEDLISTLTERKKEPLFGMAFASSGPEITKREADKHCDGNFFELVAEFKLTKRESTENIIPRELIKPESNTKEMQRIKNLFD